MNIYEPWIFKFSVTPSTHGGVVKARGCAHAPRCAALRGETLCVALAVRAQLMPRARQPLSPPSPRAQSGIHWGDVSTYPFPVSDTTLSAEAARLVILAAAGRKGLDTTAVVVPSSTPNGLPPNQFRFSASTFDATRRYFTFVNDCASQSGARQDGREGTQQPY